MYMTNTGLLKTSPRANCFEQAKPAMKRPEIQLRDVTTPARRGSQRVHYARRVSSQEVKRDPVRIFP
jgi:hypothetical protein